MFFFSNNFLKHRYFLSSSVITISTDCRIQQKIKENSFNHMKAMVEGKKENTNFFRAIWEGGVYGGGVGGGIER
jgi:hypothetical protein